MGTAFIAPRQALVDPIAVGLIGDDENAGFGGGGACRNKDCTGKERRQGSHDAPMNQNRPHSVAPKSEK